MVVLSSVSVLNIGVFLVRLLQPFCLVFLNIIPPPFPFLVFPFIYHDKIDVKISDIGQKFTIDG